jgi:hypothetical protein
MKIVENPTLKRWTIFGLSLRDINANPSGIDRAGRPYPNELRGHDPK